MAAVADVLDWLGIKESDQRTAATPIAQRVLDAVTARIASTNKLPDAPTDEQLEAWDQAHVMAAARLYGRQSSPNGVIAVGDMGPIRVGRFDSDVDMLLEQFTVWGMA